MLFNHYWMDKHLVRGIPKDTSFTRGKRYLWVGRYAGGIQTPSGPNQRENTPTLDFLEAMDCEEAEQLCTH